jgi:phage regulator Rha-like protein
MASAKATLEIEPVHGIEARIHLVRGQKIMFAADLAELYQVPVKALNQAVKRNVARFPEDFMFQLTWDEAEMFDAGSRSQTVTLNRGENLKYLPFAFTEHGIAMLASVLRSERAAQVNILIVRAFVKLREMLATHKELAERIETLERRYSSHDQEIQAIFEAIKKLLEPPAAPVHRRRIGFAN